MGDDLAGMRRDYDGPGIEPAEMAPDWWTQFDRWFDDARRQSAETEPNAMVLATVSSQGRPTARTVLLKHADASGLVFFTQYTSRKGRQLTANSAVSAVLLWKTLERQVIVDGDAVRVSAADSDEYFASRPYGSRIGAVASDQSSVVPSRRYLEETAAALRLRYPPGAVIPRPARWGGFRIEPHTVEFWQGRPDRLHDRLRYRKLEPESPDTSAWRLERLAP